MYFNNSTIVYVNGNYINATDATTSLYDQTMHYGYGVFEGIRAYNTAEGPKMFKAEAHFERLKNSCELVKIPYNFNNQELIEITYQLLKKNNLTDAYIRPLVYCSPNMTLSQPSEVNILICCWAWGAYLGDKQLDICISSFCRPHPKSVKVEAKVCGHYVNSIMATIEAKESGYDEGLLLDCDGFLAEGPGANLFIEKNGKLYTPQSGNILSGITRQTVLELCEQFNIEVNIGLFKPEFLLDADSAFYCGTAAEIIGFNSVNKQTLKQPWANSIGKKLQVAYKNLVLNKPQLALA
jgi:branched-chain amino acid aminotransferase